MLDEKTRKKLLELAGRKETPFFALSLTKLKENEKEFIQTARKFFPKLQVCYSVKTNPNPAVLKNLNCGFEVASMEELKLVKGRKSFKVFNGCCKTEKEMQEAVRQKAIIIADSFGELEKLIMLKKKLKLKSLEIGVRLHFVSKFGIQSEKIPEFLRRAEQNGLKVVMLHSHPGPKNGLQEYAKFLQNFKTAASLHDWKFLNLGSGFPSFAKLTEQHLSLNQYFEVAKTELGTTLGVGQQTKSKKLGTTFIFEPGRILVADSMFLVAKVHYLKELNVEKIAILDAGINVLQKIVLEDFKFSPLVERHGARSSFRLAGPLLFGNDWLGTTSANLKENDFLVVENIGAYCHSLAWEISYKKPKVFVI